MAFDLSKITSLLKKDIKVSSKRSVLGVDVGSSAIKIVELQDNRGVPTLTTYGELQLGPYDHVEIGRTTRLPVANLTEAFVDILREASASAPEAVLGISYNASFSTIITLSTTDTDDIPAMIPVEAKKYVPVPLNEVSLDWFPVSARAEKRTTKILLAAIHNDALKRYDAMLKGASIEMGISEIEFFSTIRSVVSQKDETVAIIDFGATSTKLYLVHKGVLGRTHSVLMSGVEMTNALAKAMNSDFRNAEETKRTVGLLGSNDEPAIQKTLIGLLDRGLREIHRVMQDYESKEHLSVEKIILSGSGALLQGLSTYATDMFARPTVIANPFAKVAYPAFLEDTLRDAGPSFAVAVGAALRGLLTK